MCPGVDSASKNEYQDIPGGKDGLCVRVTTLPPSWCRMSRRSRSLNLLESQEPFQAFSGKPLPLPYPIVCRLKGGAGHLTVFIMLLVVSSDICATQMETLNGNFLSNCSNGLLMTETHFARTVFHSQGTLWWVNGRNVVSTWNLTRLRWWLL
jgi:hypothetical protein